MRRKLIDCRGTHAAGCGRGLKNSFNAFGCIVLLALCLVSCPAAAATPNAIEASLDKAKQFIYHAQHPDGLWESPGLPHNEEGGLTAVATYALLASGESSQDPKLIKAIAYLKQLKSENVYVLGTRAQIWTYLGDTREIKILENEDARHLSSLMKIAGDAHGLFHYPKMPPTTYDLSISQFGVLGLWALAQDGAEVDINVWSTMDKAWRRRQSASGAWAYNTHGGYDEPQDTMSMALAGVATLFITHDYVHAAANRGCGGNMKDANIELGLKWVIDNFGHISSPSSAREGQARFYTLYGLERVGIASGYKYFGNANWFDAGADYLTTHQNNDGAWGSTGDLWGLNIGNIPSTSFGILFLSNGNAPAVVEKLAYPSAQPAQETGPPVKDGAVTGTASLSPQNDKQKLAVESWNERPRDLFNLSHWLATRIETQLRWIITTLEAPLADLHEAPVLYITGSTPPALSDADVVKLRQYIEQGGLILANADCGSKPFTDAILALGAKMFPQYEFRELPAEHPIYTAEQYPARQWTNKPKLLGMGNGVRELIILCPDQDLSRFWQIPYNGNLAPFALGADILEYAADKTGIDEKRVEWPEMDPRITASRTLHVARLSYDGNWDPEPAGWQRMKAISHNLDKIDLQIDVIKLGEGKLDPKVDKLATLTGTAAVRLGGAQWKELRDFINGGGMLLIDAAGGSTDFAAAMDSGLETEFGADAASLKSPTMIDDPIIPRGLLDMSLYRNYARQSIEEANIPRLRVMRIKRRPAIVLSHEDLTNGIVGARVDGVTGYTPDAATLIIRSIVRAAPR